jgi:translocation and assembly module TamB
MTGQLLRKTLKILAIVILAILGLLFCIMLYFNSSSGQKRLSNLIFNRLSKQIGTPVEGRLSFSIPDWVHLDDLLLRDLSKDTLVYAQRAHFDVGLWKLFKNELLLEQVELENAFVQLKKKDQKFNFDYLVEAFSSDAPTAPEDTTKTPLKITLKGIDLKKIRVNYEDQDIEQRFKVSLGHLSSGLNELDLQRSVFDLKDTEISGLYVQGKLGNSSTDTSTSGPLPQVKIKSLLGQDLNWDLDLGGQYTSGNKAQVALKVKELDLPSLAFEIASLTAKADRLSFKQKDAPAVRQGEINYADLALSKLSLSAENVVMKDSVMSLDMISLQAQEQSGFEVENLSGRASLKGQTALLENIALKTPGSTLKATGTLQLDSTAFMKSKLDVVIPELKVAVKDAFYFASSLKQTLPKSHQDVWTGRGRIKGSIQDMQLDNVYLTATANTRVTLDGTLHFGEVFGLNMKVKDFSTTARDLEKYVSLPDSMRLPEQMVLNGAVSGTMENLMAEAYLNSSFGGARLKGTLKGLSKVPLYAGEANIENFAVGKLLANPQIGSVTASATFDGKGFENPRVAFAGNVAEAGYAGEVYQNLQVSGTLEEQQLLAKADIKDSKATVQLDVAVDMRQPALLITGRAAVDRVDLRALGLMKEKVILVGDFDIARLVADPKKPFIDFKGTGIKVITDSTSYTVGDLSVLTEYGEKDKRLDLKGAFVNMSLAGNFEYDRLAHILKSEVNKYFKLPDFTAAADSSDYYFSINGTLSYDPVMQVFLPGIRDFQPITINSSLTSEGELPFSGHIAVPYLLYDSIQVVNTTFDFKGDGERLNYALLTDQVSNPSFRLRKADLHGKLEDNVATFDLSVKDSVDQEIHSLAGLLESDGRKVRVSFDETGSKLFYEEWGGNPYGFIDYSSAGLYIDNVVFSSGDQVLRVNSVKEEVNGPLTVFAENLDLNFLSRAILQDSTLTSGYLDLDIEVSNYMGEGVLAFTGDAEIAEFHLNEVFLGNLEARAESDNLKEITVSATLAGENNDFELKGKYFTQRKEALDFVLDIGGLDLKALEPFLKEIAYDLKGKIEGDISIKGQVAQPDINGKAEFKQAELRIKETAALLKIDGQELVIEKSRLAFKDFLVKDANGQDLTVNGAVDFSTLPNLRYNLDIVTTNFLIAQSERGQSELFYGTAYLDSKLNIRGRNAEFRLTGDVTARENTNLTLLLPDESVGEDLNAVVTFVDFSHPENNVKKNTETKMSLANAVNVNVNIDQKSTINMLMNPITGDMLSASGIGRLNIGFDNAGELFIIGNLQIVSGSYELTFQTIKKRFEITESSKSSISFAGDPTKGVMDITAEYKVPGRKDVSTYPGLDDVKDKIFADVRVDLVLKGEVLSLSEVGFQIVAKENEVSVIADELKEQGWSIVNDRGEKKSVSEGAITAANREMLKQNAIMLLVAGSFSMDQILDSFTSSTGAGYEDLARRNVSQIISSQLERYASGLIKGVDLNVGLQSSGGARVDGSDRSTNLNLGVSKRLANDRLIFSVGKNFELENKNLQSDEIFDNVEANWLISTDGRYRLKVFRKNRNQSAIEGSVIETGLGFIIAIDYDTWKELMNRKK